MKTWTPWLLSNGCQELATMCKYAATQEEEAINWRKVLLGGGEITRRVQTKDEKVLLISAQLVQQPHVGMKDEIQGKQTAIRASLSASGSRRDCVNCKSLWH